MEFLIKVRAPDSLRQKDILEDVRSGLHYHIGSGDPNDSYLNALRRVKIAIVSPKRTVKKLKRPIGGSEVPNE